MNNKLEITPETKVLELLNAYPHLEEVLIKTVPVFEKLRNPFLRKTVGKVTSLSQAAIVGQIKLSELINILRKSVGMEELQIKEERTIKQNLPEWVDDNKVTIRYDATADLNNGIHPAQKIMSEASELNDNDIYLLITPFVPAPLVAKLETKGFKVFSRNVGEEIFTYIKK